MREIARMYADIGAYTDRMEWSQAAVGVDSIRDYLLGSAITAVHYESTGRLVTFSSALGGGGNVMAPPRDALLAHLAQTEFLVLTHRRDANEPPYPMVQALEDIRPEMEAAARSRLLPIGEYTIFGRLVHLYARPVVRVVSGISGGWITSDGLLMEVPTRAGVTGPAEVTVSGGMNPWIAPDVTAACESSEDGRTRALPGSFSVEQQSYSARCAVPEDFDGDGRVRVRLSFTRFFVPREKGINDDLRQLVLAAPARVDVVPRQNPPAAR